tara:strand:+ start:2924 stop:3265 length:342 start_codon:yes stop_codon:yes gene_type:complete
MSFFGQSELQKTVSIAAIKRLGGYRTLEILAATISKSKAVWRAETKRDIIYLNYFNNSLLACRGETDIEAQLNLTQIGGADYLSRLSVPTTSEIIDFMKWKVREDQIIEFNNF